MRGLKFVKDHDRKRLYDRERSNDRTRTIPRLYPQIIAIII